MTSSEITAISIKLGIITGIIFYIVYIPLSRFLRQKALEKVKSNLLEDEHIVLEPQILVFPIEFIFIFGPGLALGGYILPFFVLPNVDYVLDIHKYFLPFLFVAELLMLFTAFWVCCTKLILTDKRIIFAWTFDFLYKVKHWFSKFDYLNYSDIENLEYDNDIWQNGINLYLKNKKKFIIAGYKKLRVIYSTIEKYL